MYRSRPLVAATIGMAILLTTGALSGASAPSRPPLKAGETYGVDVSSFQGNVIWPDVAHADIAFAYIKATQGTTYVNPYFQSDWEGAQTAGLSTGAYQFFSLCSSGAAQAQTFLATVGHDQLSLPPAVDLELRGNCAARPPASTVSAQLAAFVTAVQAATGRKAIFYVGLDFAAHYKLGILRRHPLWLRRTNRPSSRSVVVWQPRTLFEVPGIVGGSDLDVARLSTLQALRS